MSKMIDKIKSNWKEYKDAIEDIEHITNLEANELKAFSDECSYEITATHNKTGKQHSSKILGDSKRSVEIYIGKATRNLKVEVAKDNK